MRQSLIEVEPPLPRKISGFFDTKWAGFEYEEHANKNETVPVSVGYSA